MEFKKMLWNPNSKNGYIIYICFMKVVVKKLIDNLLKRFVMRGKEVLKTVDFAMIRHATLQ